MIKASHHFLIYPLFCLLTRWLVHLHFHKTYQEGTFNDKGLPLLIIANHTGWWDGFWILYLNIKRWKRRFFFMMLEEQLLKHWYFSRTGGFSVKRHSRSVLESIQYAVKILKDKQNMLLLFPQGQLHSMYDRCFEFQAGVGHILRQCTTEVQILMVVNLVDYHAHRRPSLHSYVEEYSSKVMDCKSLQQAYQQFYNTAIEHHINTTQR